MFQSKCMFLCFCYMIIGSYASSVPFIEKCEWNNKACLLSSSQKALPYFGKGLSDIGVPALDPFTIDEVVLDQGGLKIVFKGMTVTGATKCKITNVERDIDEGYLIVEAECPIVVHGTYTASGAILSVPIEGNGPFLVETGNLFISVKVGLTTVDGADGQKHWKIGKAETKYEVLGKAVLKFENLFNGDKSKADPINALFEQNGKEVVHSVGGEIVDKVIEHVVDSIKGLTDKVPASDLEL